MRTFAAGLVAMAAIGAGCLTIPTAARAQPRGSYAETCRNAAASGGVLSARCLDARGRSHDTSLGYTTCRGDIANVNGVLSCQGGTPAANGRGQGDYYPQGSGAVRREPGNQYGYPDRGYDQGRGAGPYDNR